MAPNYSIDFYLNYYKSYISPHIIGEEQYRDQIAKLLANLEFRSIPPTDWIRSVYHKKENRTLAFSLTDQADRAYIEKIRRRNSRQELAEGDHNLELLRAYIKISKKDIEAVMRWLGIKSFREFLFYKRVDSDHVPLSLQCIQSGLITRSYLVKYIDVYREYYEEFGYLQNIVQIDEIMLLKERVYNKEFFKVFS